MLDKKDIKMLLRYMNKYDDDREQLIKKSRDVLKLSKQIIFALHREDAKSAEKLVKEIDKEYKALLNIASTPLLQQVGNYKIAVQEYVEALTYYGFVIGKKIATHSELGASPELYLAGLCDLTGELVRKAINDAINGNHKSAFEIKKVVEELYGQLLMFDFRESSLRKSFDRIKYDLKRLEDVAIGIKLKNA